MPEFRDTGPQISPDDIAAVETRIQRRLPADLRAHYLRYNGGVPVPACFEDGHGGEHQVHEFRPMLRRLHPNSPTFEETYEALVLKKRLIPENLVPFATNGGNDFYCMDARTQEIYFFAMDNCANPDEAKRLVAGSLTQFLEAMIPEDELFG